MPGVYDALRWSNDGPLVRFPQGDDEEQVARAAVLPGGYVVFDHHQGIWYPDISGKIKEV